MNLVAVSVSTNQDDYASESTIPPNSQLYLFLNDLSQINTPNDHGWTPLYRSVILGNLQITTELLQKGADPNQINGMGETALYQAIEMDSYDQANALLSFSANPNLAKNDGMLPLHCAVAKSNIALVKLLLEHKALPDLQNRLYKQTALHIAIKSCVKLEIIQLLLQYKASLAVKDKYDKTPLDYADLNNEELMAYLNNEICQFSNHPSPLSKKLFSTPLSSTSVAKSAKTNQFSIKKAPTSNFLISTPKGDNSTNTYHENNVFTLENGLASFYTNNSKKQTSGKDIISEISPLITTSNNNSHIFSELQENTTSIRDETENKKADSVNNIQSSLNDIDISDLPKACFDKKKNEIEVEFERNESPRPMNSSHLTRKLNQKCNKQVKISYHRSSGIVKDKEHNCSNSTLNNDINKENNHNIGNMRVSKPLDYFSDKQTDFDSNIGVAKNTIVSSRLYSVNSTQLQTQTQPLLGINTKKQFNTEQNQSAFDKYISKGYTHCLHKDSTINKYNFNQVKPLYDWLSSIDLLCYFNTFTSKGLFEIEPLINQLRAGEIDLTLNDIEEFGIKKAGHVFRFILKAQCDANLFESILINYLFGNRTIHGNQKPNNSQEPDNYLRLSKNSTVCGCFIISKTTISKDIDLTTWLNLKGLHHLKNNFTHNGFELFEYVLLQMFSAFSFTEESIIEFLHIYNASDRKKLLKELLIEKNRICDKLGMKYNDITCDDDNAAHCQMCFVF